MQGPRPPMQPSSSRFMEIPPAIPACRPALPTPISIRQSGAVLKVNEGLNDSQPPEPKALAYISAGSTSNPLGIRPSSALTSSTHVPQKSVPTGPRSLTASMAPKKPVIVGSQWSAARSSSSSSQASNGNFSTTSNSSSLTTLPPSPVIPTVYKSAPSFVRATLSQILPYASPSPPPPPESEPPPPPPPPESTESIANKWKRISNVGDSSKPGTTLKSTGVAPGSNGNPSNTKDDLKPTASANILEGSLKRHHDEIKGPVVPNQQSDATQEQPSKKARTTPQKPSTSASATPHTFAVKREVSTASATIPKPTANVITQKRKRLFNLSYIHPTLLFFQYLLLAPIRFHPSLQRRVLPIDRYHQNANAVLNHPNQNALPRELIGHQLSPVLRHGCKIVCLVQISVYRRSSLTLMVLRSR